MGANGLTGGERAETYRRLFLINRSFHFIVQRLDELAQASIFDRRNMAELREFTQEVQLEINTTLLSPLHSVELDDWGQFGKIRIALEKRLKNPLPRTKPRVSTHTGKDSPARFKGGKRKILRPYSPA